MKRILYYLGKLRNAAVRCFSPRRIKRYGLRIALLDFGAFLCHRSGSATEHALTRWKDELVQEYLRKRYGDVISKYRDAP